jgi:hypothetical protein
MIRIYENSGPNPLPAQNPYHYVIYSISEIPDYFGDYDEEEAYRERRGVLRGPI